MLRALLAIVGGLVAALMVSGCGGSNHLSLQCAPKPAGALCIKVFGKGLTVSDVIGYLSASNSPLADRKWRLALASYPCDPGSGSVPSCRPTRIYPGPKRHGNPPIEVYCRVAGSGSTAVVTTGNGCHDTLAAEYATLDEFAGFKVPKTFGSKVWLCVSEVVVSGPPPPPAPPARACAEIS